MREQTVRENRGGEIYEYLPLGNYCIVLEVSPQKDAGSLQRPVAHTGSYTMEATLLFVLEVSPQKDAGSLQRPVAHTGSYTMEATFLGAR